MRYHRAEIAANRTEAVTNSYAVQFLGASRERIAGSQQGLAAYAMDAQSDQIAQSIHNGTWCVSHAVSMLLPASRRHVNALGQYPCIR